MIAVVALASAFAAPATDDAVYLTVAYCPDLFSGMGAVVRVNHTDGAFTIQGKFALPSSSIGCPMNEDVNYFSDVRHRDVAAALSRGRATHLSWGTDWGRLSVVGLDGGKVVPPDAMTVPSSSSAAATSSACSASARRERRDFLRSERSLFGMRQKIARRRPR